MAVTLQGTEPCKQTVFWEPVMIQIQAVILLILTVILQGTKPKQTAFCEPVMGLIQAVILHILTIILQGTEPKQTAFCEPVM